MKYLCFQENVRLKVCCLAYNGLGEEGGLAMAEALCHNSVLRELDLTGNRISEGCISNIAKALLVNESLQILRVRNLICITSHFACWRGGKKKKKEIASASS